jgi:hypothetical protein
MNPLEHLPPRLLTRRQMLRQMGTGLGLLGLTGVLGDARLLVPAANASAVNPLAAKPPHFPPRAKHIIHIYLNGGPGQMDTFDPKPAREVGGQKLALALPPTTHGQRCRRPSFQPYGERH